jgi:hypothetical protein
MRISSLRPVAIVLAAGIGLGGCASYSPYGYGSGVSVGYGNAGYGDPYYDGYSGYGYGSPYGYGAGYGYGSGYGYAPYYGWNNGYYYPGTGYYVYDSYRRPRVWTEAERQYWAERASRPGTTTTRKLLDNWVGFSQGGQAGAQSPQSTQTTRAVRGSGGRTIRVQRSPDSDSSPIRTRSERAATRAERGIFRGEGASTRSRPAPQSE